MTSQTQKVDLAVDARWIIPAEPLGTVLENHTLVVDAGVIIDLLPSEQIADHYQVTDHRKLAEHVLTPGLINMHGHAAMSLLRGYADDVELMAWLQKHIWPTEARHVCPQFVRDGTNLAIAEMLLTGTTCFSDMYFFPDVAAQCAIDVGMRAQILAPILEMPSPWARNSDEYITKAVGVRKDYKSSPLLSMGFGPHAPYTNSDETLERVAVLASETDAPIQMHVHETEQEIHESLSECGRRPLERLDELQVLSPRFQAVHLTSINDSDIELLARSGTHAIHCPASNLKLASGFCPVASLQEKGVNVALGTDGAASNNSLDLLSDSRLAALLAKAVSGDATALSAHQALATITSNGAVALGLQDRIGTLSIGKEADMVAFKFDYLRAEPIYDPASQLIYSAGAGQVSDSWIGGQQMVENGELCTLDPGAVRQAALNWRQRIGVHQ